MKISERDAVRDAGGIPVVGADGRLVTDKSSPRLTAWESDGLIWDAGVMWRPSSRTALKRAMAVAMTATPIPAASATPPMPIPV